MSVLFGTLMTAAVMVAPVADVVTLDAVPSFATAAQQKADGSEDDGGEDGDDPHCTSLVCVDVVATDSLSFSAPTTNADLPAASEPDFLSPESAQLNASPPVEVLPPSAPPVETTATEPAPTEPAPVVSVVPVPSESVATEPAAAPTLSTQTNAQGLNPSYSDATPLPVSGKVMYYAPGVMDRVINYRTRENSIDACAECVGHVALLRVGDINRKVWILLEDGTLEGPFLVVDVAHPNHVDALLARDWVVDVDWETAQRWSMKGPIAGTVLDAPPTN